MSESPSKAFGYLFAGIIAFTLLAGLAVGIGVSIWGALEVSRGISSRDWPTVEGTVISADILPADPESSGSGCLVKIVYAYGVSGKQFRGERQRYDGRGLYCGERDTASRYVAKHTAGGRILVRYNPHHPSRSVIEPGFHRSALVILAGGVVILLGIIIMTVIFVRFFIRLRKNDTSQCVDMGKQLFGKKPTRPAIQKSAASKPAVIRTLADVRAFFVATTGDEALSKLLAEVADRTGPYGYLAIQQGGTGEPYSADYMSTPEDDPRLPFGENKAWAAEFQRLQQQIATTTSAPDRDELERKLAILTYSLCTLHIRAPSSADFRSRSDAIRKAWAEFKEIRNVKRPSANKAPEATR